MLNYIVKYELSINEIKYHPLPDKYKFPLDEKYFAEDIEQLGELIAYPLGYNKALQIQRGQAMPSEKKKLKIFTNFRSAKDFVNSYNNTNSLKPSMELAIHINKLVMDGIVDEWDLGTLRKFSDKPNDIYDTWYKQRDFYPNVDVVSYFNEIFEWIQNGRDTNHKLIKMCILVYDFIDKAPFTAGNQITAVLMLEILSKKYGYNPNNIFPFFKSIYFISEDILSALRLSKGKHDLTMFLEALLYTMSKTSIEVSTEVRNTYLQKVKKQGSLELILNPRQIQLIDYLTVNQKITRGKFTKMMGVSFMTCYRDIQDLLDKKYIKQKGRGRGTFYVLSKEFADKEDIIIDEDN